MVNAPGGIAFPLEASWWIDGQIGGPTTEATGVFLREHRRNQAILQAHPPARLPRLPGQRRRYGFPPQR